MTGLLPSVQQQYIVMNLPSTRLSNFVKTDNGGGFEITCLGGAYLGAATFPARNQ